VLEGGEIGTHQNRICVIPWLRSVRRNNHVRKRFSGVNEISCPRAQRGFRSHFQTAPSEYKMLGIHFFVLCLTQSLITHLLKSESLKSITRFKPLSLLVLLVIKGTGVSASFVPAFVTSFTFWMLISPASNDDLLTGSLKVKFSILRRAKKVRRG